MCMYRELRCATPLQLPFRVGCSFLSNAILCKCSYCVSSLYSFEKEKRRPTMKMSILIRIFFIQLLDGAKRLSFYGSSPFCSLDSCLVILLLLLQNEKCTMAKSHCQVPPIQFRERLVGKYKSNSKRE